MKRWFSASFAAGVLFTAVVVLGVAKLPEAVFRQEDKMLQESLLQRHREPGRLAFEGEDLYLLRTLHSRGELMQNEENGYVPAAPDTAALRAQITPVFNEMAKAGILPPTIYAELGIIAERDESLTGYYEDGAGFIQALYSGEKGGIVHSFGFEMEPKTGLLVNIWVNTSVEVKEITEGFDKEAAVSAYKSWLGLDILDDWQDGESSYYDVSEFSQKGLSKLYLLCDGKILHMGIIALGK